MRGTTLFGVGRDACSTSATTSAMQSVYGSTYDWILSSNVEQTYVTASQLTLDNPERRESGTDAPFYLGYNGGESDGSRRSSDLTTVASLSPCSPLYLGPASCFSPNYKSDDFLSPLRLPECADYPEPESKYPSEEDPGAPRTAVVDPHQAHEMADAVLEAFDSNALEALDYLRKVMCLVGAHVAHLSGMVDDLVGKAPEPVYFSGPSFSSGESHASIMPIPYISDARDHFETAVVLLIPGEQSIIGHVIGRSGQEIANLESRTSTSIKIHHTPVHAATLADKSSQPSSAGERLCVIRGTVTQCIEAQRQLSAKIRLRMQSDGLHHDVLRFVICNEYVRHLIGAGGAKISEFQVKSRATIQVSPELNTSFDNIGRVVALGGPEPSRAMAIYLIARHMQENSHDQWAKDLISQIDGLTGIKYSPRPTKPAYEMKSSLTPTAPSWPPIHYLDAPSPFGSHERPSLLKRNSSGSSFDNGSNSSSINSAVSPRHSCLYVKPRALKHLRAPGATTEEYVAQPLLDRFSPDRFSPQSSERVTPLSSLASHAEDSIITSTYSIPQASVSFIIGKQGSSVKELELQTKAKVTIEKPSKFTQPEQMQPVYLHGTPVAIKAAISLIAQRVDLYFHSVNSASSALEKQLAAAAAAAAASSPR